MNDLDLLTQLVELHPGNPICAAMLTDELMNTRDMNRSEADKHVENVTKVAVQVRELREAVELLNNTSRPARRLLRHVRSQFNASSMPAYSLMVCAGDAAPVFTSRSQQPHAPGMLTSVVTVGAGWLLAAWAEICNERSRRRRRST